MRSPTPDDEEINGIKAYIPRLRTARWPKGFKPVPIKKYDGQTNPREWLQLYSTTIRSARGDTYLMENYLSDCLDPAIRMWLTSLLEESSDEPLHDYIKQFCAKKTEIPNIPDQQIIAAFQGGIHSGDLLWEISRKNHDLKLNARECFEIADKFASGESALDNIRGKGKEKRSDKPESSKKDKKRKSNNMVATELRC
ncbi:hypothetical protein PR202_gb23699 [Eleusine coracana subsp. coracana]|uniref:Gag protein n=1 Tax=Eleusine coracana subsp. coracana TaxID=191504 RepID=A0AAV5FKR5_ELECO|nr:hypothetical protein PR202_gb23699 [Eleusine coracana subsp. coracana]